MPMSLTIPSGELFDNKNDEYIYTKETTITVEHSLVSLSRWESKWKKAFLHNPKDRTIGELRGYVQCMTITQNVDPIVYLALSQENLEAIMNYINDPMTATHFARATNKTVTNTEVITSELIYYWMIEYNVPFHPCEKWHLNRLLALIETCGRKSAGPQKMTKDMLMHRNALNAKRRAMHHSKG